MLNETEDDDLVAPPAAARKNTRPTAAPTARAGTNRTEPVRRRKRGSKGEDHFYIPEPMQDQLRAKGLSWEFKRLTYFGKEEDPDYHIGLAENAWEPLSLKSYPDFKRLLPSNWTKDTFEKRGQILMVRPEILTKEARAEDEYAANSQVKGQLQSLKEAKAGEAPRDNKGNPLVRVNRSYEAPIPVD